jgi:DNA-binding XRE family transcriptional regulator
MVPSRISDVRHKHFNELELKPVKIVYMDDCDGLWTGKEIHVSTGFLERNPCRVEVEKLLTHELIHRLLPPGYEHSLEFFEIAEELGIVGPVELHGLLDFNKSHLEGRISTHLNDEGEEIVTIRKAPSWNGLKEMVDINYLDLGLALRRLREIHGLSQRYLANEVGISTYRLKKIEESKGADTDPLYTNLVR